MFSQRFDCKIILTEHARRRMSQRGMSEPLLQQIVERGEVRYRDPAHLWIAMNAVGRSDNLLCVAAVIEEVLIIKTVMHHFSWEETP